MTALSVHFYKAWNQCTTLGLGNFDILFDSYKMHKYFAGMVMYGLDVNVCWKIRCC